MKIIRKMAQNNLKLFREIYKEYHDAGDDHHLKLTCAICQTTETCRCSAPKTEIVGICEKCYDDQNK